MANVIDTLIYKLGMDNTEYKKKMEDSIDEAEELEGSFDKLEDTIEGATTAGTFFGQLLFKGLELVVGAVKKAVDEYDGYIDSLRLIHRETGQSIEDYQKWAYAIEYAGGNVNSFTSTFEKLSKQIRQAPFTHNSTFLRGLSELGISVHYANGHIKSMSDLLLGLAGRLSRMSEGKALLLGQRLGLDDDTIRLLHEGKDAVQAYLDKTKEESLIQKKNLELYEKLRKARVEISRGWKEFSNIVGNTVLPLLVKLSEIWLSFTGFLRENSDFLRHTGKLIAIIAMGLAQALILVGAITKAMTLLKFALWGLGIGALIVIWDDFMTYLEGGESVIGHVIEWFQKFGASAKEFFVDKMQYVKDFLSGFTDWFAQKIEWCINLYDRFAGKIRTLLGWFGIGKDVYDMVGAVGAGGVSNSTSSVSNSTTRFDFPNAKLYFNGVNNPEEFMTMLPQQAVANSGGMVR